ncbi:hypothetical protein TrVE_jg7276 [Triparma verrucosa]|uniref:rRNA-processing protein EBP2 n=1 Tax=Triparma verrucosa TaxID=1606542 RepID=A0A9W7F2M0_9STRA|nr:hypothetical protein TrVE_jg7276 [Triparma verrucosa]
MPKKTKKTSSKRKAPSPEPESDPEDFEDVQMSDEEQDGGADSDDLDTTVEIDDEDEYAAEARALKAAMEEGAFSKLVGGEKMNADEDSDDAEGSDEDDEQKAREEVLARDKAANGGFANNIRGLQSATASILSRALPWEERLDLVSPDAISPPSDPLNVNDDLKREVAFYNVALSAVRSGKKRFKSTNMPFTRPTDYFAEMVKSDAHMAKIKDRLIFESKKMTAFEQRKSNKESKSREKEKRDAKLKEKAKEKRDNLGKVEEWKKEAKERRGQGIGDYDDAGIQDKIGFNGDNNFKRERADKKYGFGGKSGKFKKSDKKKLNDMSDYNPRGNFKGGMKSSRKTGGGDGGGKKRQGKRARDAKRASK